MPGPSFYFVMDSRDVDADDPRADHEETVDDQLQKNHDR
jgi:hypothetical protein